MKLSIVASAIACVFSVPAMSATPSGVWIKGDNVEQTVFKDIYVDDSNFVQDWSTKTTAGIYVGSDTKAIFSGGLSEIKIIDEKVTQTAGVAVQGGGVANFEADETNISVSSKGTSLRWGFAVIAEGEGSTINFIGNNVAIYGKQSDYTSQTLTAGAGATINFDNAGDVVIESESSFGVTAVDASGVLNFNNSGNVLIKGTILPGTQTAQTNVVGIQGSGGVWSVTEEVGDFSIVLNGQGVDNNGTSYSTGTKAIDGSDTTFKFYGGSLNIQMDIATDVEDASPDGHTAEEAFGINLSGDSTFSLGAESTLSIAINEGIGTAYGITLSGSDADIKGSTNISATGVKESYSIYLDEISSAKFSGTSNTLTGDALIENGSILSFTNGGTTINGDVTLDESSSVAVEDAFLTLNGKMTQSSSTNPVEDSESGLTINRSTLAIGDAVTLKELVADSATILYMNIDEGTAFSTDSSVIGEGGIQVAASGELNDSTHDAAGLMREIAARSTTGTGTSREQLTDVVVLQEGTLVGERVGQVLSDGSVKIIRDAGASQSVKSIGDASASNLLIWRSEMNSLNKRLGELRDSEGNVGAWARVNAGSFSGGDMNIDNDFVTLQVGADTKLPTIADIHVGGAFGYTNGDLSYEQGDGTTKSYSFALYGSWLGEQGQFLDVIAKYARLSTEASAGSLNANFDSNAFSLSAEVGWRIDSSAFPFFVEPQAELSYGYVDGQTFRVSDQISADQDKMDSLVGRIGFRLGAQCPEKRGNVYLHASLLHDFLGDASVTMRNDVQSVNYVQDFGDTWFEYGIGGTLRVTNSSYIFADLQRTDGGDVDEDWRANIGIRLAF